MEKWRVMSDNLDDIFGVLGYELNRFEQALTLTIKYCRMQDDGKSQDHETPCLVLFVDEAKELARDLLMLAEKIEAGASAPPAVQ